MTEQEWLVCDSVREMLLDLAKGDLAQKHRLLALGYYFPSEGLIRPRLDRKLHLFACGCVRRVWSRLPDERMGVAVEVVERLVDKKASREELITAGSFTPHAWDDSGWCAAWYGYRWAVDFAVDKNSEQKEQVKLLHDVLGNPFRPVAINPAWLTWNDGVVVRLAQASYEERIMPEGTLDYSLPAILADALEEAGCTDTEILNHCRQPGEHVRGCWVVDLCLGKS